MSLPRPWTLRRSAGWNGSERESGGWEKRSEGHSNQPGRGVQKQENLTARKRKRPRERCPTECVPKLADAVLDVTNDKILGTFTML